MPNHVHALLTPEEGHSLGRILHSWKSYTAHEALKILDAQDEHAGRVRSLGQQEGRVRSLGEQAGRVRSRRGRFWQKESFDRFIRDEEHFRNCIEYVHMNPVKARLCAVPKDWPWSSARKDA